MGQELEGWSNLNGEECGKSSFRGQDQELNFGHESSSRERSVLKHINLAVLGREMVFKASKLVDITKGVGVGREKN